MPIFWGPPGGGTSGGGGTVSGTGVNVRPYDDLTPQIDGSATVFTVSQGKYIAGSLNICIGGMSGFRKGVDFIETNPSGGQFSVARALEASDIPLVAQYTWS